jgi:hypothetical protein
MIENEGGFGMDSFVLTCDICGEEANEMFDTFQEAVDFKRDRENGWISRKTSGEWEDVCPNCH